MTFKQYQDFVWEAASDQTTLELWMYYDAYRSFFATWEGTIPGTEGIGEFEVNGQLAKDKLESCIRRMGNQFLRNCNLSISRNFKIKYGFCVVI